MQNKFNVEALLDQEIMSRIRANRNFIGICTGVTGGGKSYSCIKIGEMIFRDFTVDSIVFSVREFLDIFEEQKPGSLIVFDESEDLNARTSMSLKNTLFSEIMAMLRFSRVSVIFNLPSAEMLDVNMFRLFHGLFTAIDFDRKSPTCPEWKKTRSGLKYYRVTPASLPGTDARKYPLSYPYLPQVVRQGGNLYKKSCKVTELWFDLPSADILEEYEKRKQQHFKSIFKVTREKLKMNEIKERAAMEKAGVFSSENRNPSPQTTAPAQVQATGRRYVGSIDENIAEMMTR